jgi:hypothetical protein
MLASVADTWAAPPSSWTPVSVKLVQHASSRRVTTGANSAPPFRPASTSSCTTSSLSIALPTTFTSSRRYGRPPGWPAA